ncbi:hypothetical protein [Sphingobacterium corticibacter]
MDHFFIEEAFTRAWRAFDKKTGKMVWETSLPAANNANVCSFSIGGKQFITLGVGGIKENLSGSVMAFALK